MISGVFFMGWGGIDRPAKFGRITMDGITRRAFGAAGFALLLATTTTLAQQQSPTVRVRGTIEGVDGPMLTVKSRDGQTTYKVKTADNVALRGVVKASLSDIKQNSFIGVTGMTQPVASPKGGGIHILSYAFRRCCVCTQTF